MPAPPVPFGVPAQFRGQTLTSYQPTFREAATDMLRRALFSDDRVGQRKAERVSNVLETVTPFGFATGIDDAKEAVGQGDYATAGLMGAMAMVPGPSPKIRAYHGSPHSFDRFDMSKIGTGEGAQAYGHGLYFAENEGVAGSYRDALSNDYFVLNGEQVHMPGLRDDWRAALKAEAAGKPMGPALQQALEEAKKAGFSTSKGSMYEVNINASPDDFLDWDKPLSEQPEKVRRGLDEAGFSPPPGGELMTGEQIIARAMQNDPGVWKNNKEYVRAAMNELGGIPGIKYLDAGSRGKGDGSRNYVVFDDKLIEIVRKYGIAGASAMAGYNILDGMDEAQAKELKKIDGSGW